jgi:hypothetical protein
VRVLVHSPRFATVILATALTFATACKKTEPKSATKAEPAAGALPLTPDTPEGFGPKCVWLAFRGATPEAVARALDLRNVAPSTWAEGLKSAYGGGVFVTPPVDGWVLAASTRFPDPGDKQHEDKATPVLTRLSQAFGEVQYFGTYDDLGWHAWARFVKGAAVRKLAYLGEQGLVIWAEGEPTPEERKLGLLYTAKGLAKPPYPREENVFALAGAWSVDPTTLQTRHLPPSLGLAGAAP